MSFVDLHLHSTASDGRLPPAAVVRRAAEAGLAGISLTDHDTVDGLDEARSEAERRGMDFLPGAELSANEPGRSVHVLAYGIDPEDPAMRDFFRLYRRDRIRRAREIVRRLNACDVPLEYGDVAREAGAGVPTRAHVGRALAAGGHVPREEAAFRRYLSRGRPAFVEKRPTPPAEVFRRVHAAGGVAILAHPGRSFGNREIRRWIREGLDGVEILHPANDPAVRIRLEELAVECGLLRGGGSDWHGGGNRHSRIGSQKVPSPWLEAIRGRTRARAEARR